MAIELDPSESQPDFVARIASESTENIEDAITRYDQLAGWTVSVNLMRNELRKRQKTVVWKLSTETRFIAWSALGFTVLQLIFQVWPSGLSCQ